jgi:hypothetical protein
MGPFKGLVRPGVGYNGIKFPVGALFGLVGIIGVGFAATGNVRLIRLH